jgi:ABC-type bacteriocin/lantibiotic exporter with double-glycine peptidase domain
LVIDQQLSLGQLVAAELIVAIVVGSFAKLGKHIESFYDLLASIDKLGVLLDLPTERTDGLLTVPESSDPEQAGIVVDQVCYQTVDGREILSKVSLQISPGEHVALAGESGVGKSLLLDLIFGLREPASGAVRINGIDPRDVRPDVLRRKVALARDIEVFDGSIMENIHLERPDISVNDVRNAAHAAGLMPAIQRLPGGLETPLNATGSPLTSGQLRRLMLARILASNPRILLIDELLDSMPDEEAERILASLLEHDPGRSIILVTNREKLKAMMKNVLVLTSQYEEGEGQ